MARKPRRTWSRLSPVTRNRYAARGQAEHGWTRKQVRERYNRGTYSPGSRVRSRRPQLMSTAVDNFDHYLTDHVSANGRYEYNPSHPRWTVRQTVTDDQLRRMGSYDEDQIVGLAAHQAPAEGVPEGPRWAWFRDDQHGWQNIFWYH